MNFIKSLEKEIAGVKVSKSVLQEALDRRKEKSSIGLREIELPMSGYKLKMAPLTTQDDLSMKTITGVTMKGYQVNLYKMIYEKSEFLGDVQPKSFKEFTNTIFDFDKDLLFQGLVEATYPELSLNFKCNNSECGAEFEAKVDTRKIKDNGKTEIKKWDNETPIGDVKYYINVSQKGDVTELTSEDDFKNHDYAIGIIYPRFIDTINTLDGNEKLNKETQKQEDLIKSLLHYVDDIVVNLDDDGIGQITSFDDKLTFLKSLSPKDSKGWIEFVYEKIKNYRHVLKVGGVCPSCGEETYRDWNPTEEIFRNLL
jgi:hypothetical protein